MSGLTISLGYFCGGAVPLLPYLFFAQVGEAFRASVAVMVVALFAFGWVKERVVDGERSVVTCIRSGVQMVVMGGLAAGAAMVCVRVLSGGEP
jgi:VIT1/CCC1 family predicted Fe2+/Mn2+ transporter